MSRLKLIYLMCLTVFGSHIVSSQEQTNRWSIAENNAISWKPVSNLPHYDHVEMSGKFISAVIRYGVNGDGSFHIKRDVVWPMLRTIPNNTHASFIRSFTIDPVAMITVNKQPVQQEKVSEIRLDGVITVNSTVNKTIGVERTLYPSTQLPAFLEKYVLVNLDKKQVTVELPEISVKTRSLASEGVEGSYTVTVRTLNAKTVKLNPSESITFYCSFSAAKDSGALSVNPDEELAKRRQLVAGFQNNLVLETPDSVLNNAFAFAKVRAAESIYQTKGGPMHGPGGLAYYAAIWANDQAEYINPFFPYLGYDYGVESALNAYQHFARFMNEEYKPIPSSIIAEGIDIWNGAGDRGDAAMIAYGAARFCLSQGDKKIANELWPLIKWCLEYNKRKLNPQGVVSSNSDELEGRFPSGSANLCTSSLYYDALISAAYLGESLSETKALLSDYQKQAKILRSNIEKYFGAGVNGFETYRYYEGNDKLRAWICIPLTVGIFERKNGTIDALFSPELWTDDGLASQAGDKTFWDRSTLYALRGVFAAGEIDRGYKFLHYYSNRRLLGDHVPYPVEAYPEGGQRHLSAESGLYCRIFTEGLFGIRPEGLKTFTLTPQLPENWDFMTLTNVHGFGETYDIAVKREAGKLRLTVTCRGKNVFNKLIENSTTHKVLL